MPRMITLGAAQTGPVNEDDWRPNVRGACKMIEEAGRRKVDILSFSELFLTPFFPNRLTRDYDKFFVTLDEPELAPIFKTAVDNRVALVFPVRRKERPQLPQRLPCHGQERQAPGHLSHDAHPGDPALGPTG